MIKYLLIFIFKECANMENIEDIGRIIIEIVSDHEGEMNKILLGDLLRAINSRLALNVPRVGARTFRQALNYVRANTDAGAWICATRKGKGGYFIARNPDELDQYTRADLADAQSTIQRIRTQRRRAKIEGDINQGRLI